MKAQGGFTLIEIMVVLFIIAGLAYIVGTNVIGQLDKSKIENTKIQITTLESALKLFKVDNGFYPDTGQGLQALITRPGSGREPMRYNSDGYIDSDQVPFDSWGAEFMYIGPDQIEGNTYEIVSPGPDGAAQTEDDISSKDI